MEPASIYFVLGIPLAGAALLALIGERRWAAEANATLSSGTLFLCPRFQRFECEKARGFASALSGNAVRTVPIESRAGRRSFRVFIVAYL